MGNQKTVISSTLPIKQWKGGGSAAVKSAKRILEGKIDQMTGKLNTEEAIRAIMMHRKTSLQETGCSP